MCSGINNNKELQLEPSIFFSLVGVLIPSFLVIFLFFSVYQFYGRDSFENIELISVLIAYSVLLLLYKMYVDFSVKLFFYSDHFVLQKKDIKMKEIKHKYLYSNIDNCTFNITKSQLTLRLSDTNIKIPKSLVKTYPFENLKSPSINVLDDLVEYLATKGVEKL